MNPEHFHLEFYEDDAGTMAGIDLVDRLEPADMADHDRHPAARSSLDLPD